MTKTIFEEMGGTYRQVGDYLLRTSQYQRRRNRADWFMGETTHARHLKEHYKVLYMNLLTSGKLH